MEARELHRWTRLGPDLQGSVIHWYCNLDIEYIIWMCVPCVVVAMSIAMLGLVAALLHWGTESRATRTSPPPGGAWERWLCASRESRDMLA